MMRLRDYQQAAVDALYAFAQKNTNNPCIVMPVGAGKSIVLAQICKDTVQLWGGRALCVTHVKELIDQNSKKLQTLCPELEVGIYSAGMKRRDTTHKVIFAGVQSVYNKADQLGHFDILLIDEAHTIPPSGEGQYRTLVAGLMDINPDIRIVGLTASPYRTSTGPLCTPDGVLNEVCYEIGIRDLIDRGYLCKLVGRNAVNCADMTGVSVRSGEFVDSEAEAAFTADELVRRAVSEIVDKTRDRNCVLIFCQTVAHSRLVADELRAEILRRAAVELIPASGNFPDAADPKHPNAPVVADWLDDHGEPTHHLRYVLANGGKVGEVYGETSSEIRDQVISEMRNCKLKYCCNVSVMTTGLDVPCIDTVVLLRATISPGLFYQMVGRGIRLSPETNKSSCVLLDFGGNLLRHGPIDALRIKTPGDKSTPTEPIIKECPDCEAIVAPGTMICPGCGYEWERAEVVPKHTTKASSASPLSGDAEEWEVSSVEYSIHTKRGASPDHPKTLRVTYIIDMTTSYIEWICVEHDGFGGKKASDWWKKRCAYPMPKSAAAAWIVAQHGLLAPTLTVKTKLNLGEQYPNIVGHTLVKIPKCPTPCPNCAKLNYRIARIVARADTIICGECGYNWGSCPKEVIDTFGHMDDGRTEYTGFLPDDWKFESAPAIPDPDEDEDEEEEIPVPEPKPPLVFDGGYTLEDCPF